jgi:acyl-CoA reductase-like NAD-dependent aldehyde dehydrogenase
MRGGGDAGVCVCCLPAWVGGWVGGCTAAPSPAPRPPPAGVAGVDAQFGEILSSCGKLQWVVDNGEEVLRTEVRPTNFTSMHKRAELRYEPLGVIGVIAPWNYPQYNFLNHVASGLFAGNAVVIKMSEYTAWTAQHIIRLYRDVLRAAGQDPDLVQLVQGFGETGAALVNMADKVIFTGSPGVGRAVMKGASETLTPLVLELGGKDPFIVCDDADGAAALTLAMRGTFQVGDCTCMPRNRTDAATARACRAIARTPQRHVHAAQSHGRRDGTCMPRNRTDDATARACRARADRRLK